MLSIRLQRRGRRNHAMFRIVVQEKHKAPNSRVQEILGFLNPHTKEVGLKKDRIAYWISVGAQPTPRLRNLLIDQGIMKGDKLRTQGRMKKRKGDEEEAKEEAPKVEKTDAAVETPVEAKPETPPVEEKPEEKPTEAPTEESKPQEPAEKEDTDKKPEEASN